MKRFPRITPVEFVRELLLVCLAHGQNSLSGVWSSAKSPFCAQNAGIRTNQQAQARQRFLPPSHQLQGRKEASRFSRE
jgi:hypothetical protein